MDSYVEQLEKQNEELKEMLAMSEADAAAYKFLLPRWKLDTKHYVNQTYVYMLPSLRLGRSFGDDSDILIGKVTACTGITPDKTWCGRLCEINDSKYMEFFITAEDAMKTITALYMEWLRAQASK